MFSLYLKIMDIYDPDGIFPDHEIIVTMLHSHPFFPGLDDEILSLTLGPPSKGEGPCIDIVDRNVSLKIHSPKIVDDVVRYILLHEFGHVADRLDPSFNYSHTERSSLPEQKMSNFIEIWNLYIDARLNHKGLFRLVGPAQTPVRVNGRFELKNSSVETKLCQHVHFLSEHRFRDAKAVVHSIWQNPLQRLSFPSIILLLKEHMY